jgi:hypothetical protein
LPSSPAVLFPISREPNHDSQRSRLMRWCFRGGASEWSSPDAAQRVSGALLIRGPTCLTTNGPGSAARYCAPHRVRDTISSSRIKDKAGDDEHRRHRQQLRKRFRGRLFGGFPHTVLPRPGHDSSLRESANDVRNFTRNTPRRVFAGLSPHSGEYRLSQGRTAMRRHFGSHAAGLCAADGILKAIFGRGAGSRMLQAVAPVSSAG